MNTTNSALKIVIMSLLAMSLWACGSSSDSGMLISGTLTEGGGAAHTSSIVVRHSDGQLIEEVNICALERCSITDDLGQWGFIADESFVGGPIILTIQGHGIDTATSVDIPEGANDVFLDLQHVEGGIVEVHHMTVDGETQHFEQHHEEDVHVEAHQEE